MTRRILSEQVSRVLGNRQLVWVGTRGVDIESISDLPQLTSVVSVIGRYRNRSRFNALSLEELSGSRVDLDTFDIDDEPRETHRVEFRRALLRLLSQPSAVITYRPSIMVSGVCFARQERCEYLGLFSGHQAAFEHKPWVETSLAAEGIPTLEWIYVADDDQMDVRQLLDKGPVVLRRSRTTGGVGLTQLSDSRQLGEVWPWQDEAYVSVAPYMVDGIPVNVGAVVWNDGVTLHPASVQLIGVPCLTDRPFGYCGNDFGLASELGGKVLDRLDDYTRRIGSWLHRYGYRGAYGVDFLVSHDDVYFTEINPRLQGSTHLSSEVMTELDESGIVLEHLAALAGVGMPIGRGLRELADMVPKWAHFVVHAPRDGINSSEVRTLLTEVTRLPGFLHVDTALEEPIVAERGAAVARITVTSGITDTGFSLRQPWQNAVAAWRNRTKNDVLVQ